MKKLINMNEKKIFFLIITLIFFIGLLIKSEYIGTLSNGHHQFGTALTKLTVENWIEEGIKENNFIRALIPQSIEYQNFKDRGLYISYPIGTDFLTYIFKLIFKNTETLKIIHLLSAFFHYLIAIFIFIFVSSLKFNLDKKIINNFALIASISYIILPIPFYYHLMLFSFDQSIILPFILILFLEFLIREKQKNKYFIIQSSVFFISGFFDYFNIILGLSIFLFRIILPLKNKNIFKDFFQIILPISLPFLIHCYNLYSNDLLINLFQRFTKRTGIDYATSKKVKVAYESFIYHFWIKKFHIYIPILIFSIFFLIKNLTKSKFKNNSFLVILIGFFSATLYSLIFNDFAAIHDFATLKFYPLISISFFALIPLKIIEFYKENSNRKNFNKYFIWLKVNFANKIFFLVLISLFFIIILDNSIRLIYYSNINKKDNYIFYQNKFYKNFILSQFPYPQVNNEKILKKINEISNYNDIFISLTNFSVSILPPQNLSISKKIVKPVKSKNELITIIKAIPDKANLKVIINETDKCKELFDENKKITVEKKIIIFFDKKELSKIINCL